MAARTGALRQWLRTLQEAIQEEAQAAVRPFTRGGLLDYSTGNATGRVPHERGGTGRGDGMAEPLPGSVTGDKLAAGAVSDEHVADDAGIAWAKVSKVGALPGHIGAAAAVHTHAAGDVTTGTLPVARGGTGAGTAAAALAALLPAQSGHAGDVLTTDGTAASWQTPTGGGGGGGGGASGVVIPVLDTGEIGSAAPYFDVTVPADLARLEIQITGRTTDTGGSNPTNLLWQANGDTGANYGRQSLYGTSTTAGAYPESGMTAATVGALPSGSATSGTRGVVRVSISEPGSTAGHKTLIGDLYSPDSSLVVIVGGVWRATAAITTLRVYPAAGNFAAGTRLIAFGWNAASTGTSGALVPLDEVVLTADAASIDFSSIPTSGYRHLVVEGLLRLTNSGTYGACYLRLNGDTAGHYDWALDYGGTDGQKNVSQASIGLFAAGNSPSGSFGPLTLRIPYFLATSQNKQWTGQSFRPDQNLTCNVGGRWASTAAVTSLSFFSDSGVNIAAGSALTLYGVV